MRRLRVAGENYYVADELADALLQYLRALAESPGSGLIALPALTVDGEPTRLEFVAAASTQVLVTPAAVALAEPASAEAVARLRQLTSRLAPEQVHLTHPQDSGQRDVEFDEHAEA